MSNTLPCDGRKLPIFRLIHRRSKRSFGTYLIALAVLVCMVSAPISAWALDPHRALTQALLRKWQFQQGLPQPTINKILQTADGYIWLGTPSGLYRFDGIRFTAAPEEGKASLADLWIQDLCEDRGHGLWIATNDSGLVRLKAGKAVSLGLAEGLPSINVRCLLIARNGDLWIGTDQGLARCAADKLLDRQAARPFDRLPRRSGNRHKRRVRAVRSTRWHDLDGRRWRAAQCLGWVCIFVSRADFPSCPGIGPRIVKRPGWRRVGRHHGRALPGARQ